MSMPVEDTDVSQEVPELHNNAPKRVTTPRAAVVETETVKGFHPEARRGEGNHNGAPKRVTTPAGIAAAGAYALGFRPEKPSDHIPVLRNHPLSPRKASKT
jgi:hypothetical protein